MILDQQSILSDAQAVTATAYSTNVLDLHAMGMPFGSIEAPRRDLGLGKTDIPLLVQVVESFASGTSVQADVVSSDDPAFGSGVLTHWTSGVIPVASLTAGTRLPISEVPEGGAAGMNRYMAIKYTVVGTPTAGKFTAGLTMGVQSNATP